MSEVDEAPTAGWGMGDAVVGIVASLVLSVVGVGVVAAVGDYDTIDDFPLWVQTIAQVPLWLGLLGAVLYASRRKGTGSLRDDFGLEMRPVDVPIGLVAGFVGQLAIVVVALPVYRVLGVDTERVGETAERLADRAATGLDVFFLVLIVVLGAPLVEELFHRGLVLGAMERRWGTGVAVAGSSLAFAALHFQVYDLLPLGLAGLLFAVLRVRAGRLGPAIWAHVAFNLTAVIALLVS